MTRLQGKASESTVTELLTAYGIPVTVNYLYMGKPDIEKIRMSVQRSLERLYTTGSVADLLTVAHQSIALSPYPEGFKGLSWRDLDIWRLVRAKSQTWWVDYDNKGTAPLHYSRLVTIDES